MSDETYTDPSDLYDVPVDAAEAAEITKRNAKPAGDYVTDPDSFGEFSDTIQRAEDGRVSISLFGRANRPSRTGETVANTLRYKISPEARRKKVYVDGKDTGTVDENKDDIQTRLYAEAVSAYTAVRGEVPKNVGQLVEWLKGGSYTLNTMLGGDGELVVLHIKAPRRAR